MMGGITAEKRQKDNPVVGICNRSVQLGETWSSSFASPLVLFLTSVLRSQWSCMTAENKTRIVFFEFVVKWGSVIWSVTKTKCLLQHLPNFLLRADWLCWTELISTMRPASIWTFTCSLHTFLYIKSVYMMLCNSSYKNVGTNGTIAAAKGHCAS